MSVPMNFVDPSAIKTPKIPGWPELPPWKFRFHVWLLTALWFTSCASLMPAQMTEPCILRVHSFSVAFSTNAIVFVRPS